MALQDKIARSLHEISSAIHDGAFQFKTVAGGVSLLGDRPFVYMDDFTEDTVAYTDTNDGGTGTNAFQDAAAGWYNVVTAGVDNDYHLMSSDNEVFIFDASKELYFETLLKLTEANTDDANIVVGLSDTLTTGFLADNGGGPPASYDGAVFFKVDGGTVWQFESSNAGTQVTDSDVGAFSSGTATKLAFHYDPNDGTTGVITYYYNGTSVGTQNITIAGLEEMHLIFGVKAGGANAETLEVDYLYVEQQR